MARFSNLKSKFFKSWESTKEMAFKVNQKFPNHSDKLGKALMLGSVYSIVSLAYEQLYTKSTKELFDDSDATMELRFKASNEETEKLRREVVNLTALSQSHEEERKKDHEEMLSVLKDRRGWWSWFN